MTTTVEQSTQGGRVPMQLRGFLPCWCGSSHDRTTYYPYKLATARALSSVPPARCPHHSAVSPCIRRRRTTQQSVRYRIPLSNFASADAGPHSSRLAIGFLYLILLILTTKEEKHICIILDIDLPGPNNAKRNAVDVHVVIYACPRFNSLPTLKGHLGAY